MTQLYSLPPYTYPVPKIPYVTLTLAANDGLGKLTVWYTRAIEAGIAEPTSVTVSDEFGNSTTTTFTPQASNGVFGQDVAFAGMQGTVLHLNFTSKREWVGLNEIKVVPGLPEPGYVTWAGTGPGGKGLAGPPPPLMRIPTSTASLTESSLSSAATPIPPIPALTPAPGSPPWRRPVTTWSSPSPARMRRPTSTRSSSSSPTC